MVRESLRGAASAVKTVLNSAIVGKALRLLELIAVIGLNWSYPDPGFGEGSVREGRVEGVCEENAAY